MRECLMSVIIMTHKEDSTIGIDEYNTDYLIVYCAFDLTNIDDYRINIPIKKNLPLADIGLIISNFIGRNHAIMIRECYVAVGRETIKLDFEWTRIIGKLKDSYKYISNNYDDNKFEQHLKDSCDNNERIN